MMKKTDAASFRDPSGFIFLQGDELYRQINDGYRTHYDQLMGSGLYDALVGKGMLIPHREVRVKTSTPSYKVIRPDRIPFISYPYEWCFGELKDAALLTLRIMRTSLSYGMVLKDATSFNVQFANGKPVFIDTLSFEAYREGHPWVAYKQFCEQFVSPLAVAAYTDTRLLKMLATSEAAIPLDLAATLLPVASRFNPGLFMHIYLHARSQKQVSRVTTKQKNSRSFRRGSLLGLLDSLESTVKSLRLPERQTVWSVYGSESGVSYSRTGLADKRQTVARMLAETKSCLVWDIGANTGSYSRLAAEKGMFTVSMDSDFMAVEENYRQVKRDGESRILPLLIDFTNPTPAIGWANAEREGLFGRPHPDTILALALVHHLAIANNLPFSLLADVFAKLTKNLIIEFVPKTDKMIGKLLEAREDIFPWYGQDSFEREFGRRFTIRSKHAVQDSQRVLYLMQAR